MLYMFLESWPVGIITFFIVPVILLFAARALWHSAPRWMAYVIGTTAVVRVLILLPSFFMYPMMPRGGGEIARVLFLTISMVLPLVNMLFAIAFPIAVLGMARHMKKMKAEQGNQVSSEAPPPVSPEE